MVKSETPDWRPLKNLVEAEIVGEFMWMFELETFDGRPIHAYKHIETRRYLHIGPDGEVFVYEPENQYLRVDPRELVRLALGLPADGH